MNDIPTQPESNPRRRRGFVARLPKEDRDRLNRALDDGCTYAEVITQLGPAGAHLTEDHIRSWMSGGYQEWLRQQSWIEGMRTQLDFAMDVIQQDQAAVIHQANLHIAATQLIEALRSFHASKLQDDPAVYTRILHSIARLGHEAITFQKYREACASARATLDGLRDPKRELNDDERLAIIDKVDRILGLK